MRVACGWLCVLILASCAQGQSSPLAATSQMGTEVGPNPPSSLLSPSVVPSDGEQTPGAGLQHFLDAKLLLGFPTGIRLQAALDREKNYAVLAEAFAGYELANPLFGVGGRLVLAPASGRSGDVLIVAPGLNFYRFVGVRPGGEVASEQDGSFIIPDLEVAWLHDFFTHFAWELGLDVGLGVGFWQSPESTGRITALPLISAFSGFRF